MEIGSASAHLFRIPEDALDPAIGSSTRAAGGSGPEADRAASAQAGRPDTTASTRVEFIRNGGPIGVLYHAGDSAARPRIANENEWENSFAALSSAYERHPDAVEIDVRLNTHPNSITAATPFGILFVKHEGTGRATDENGRVQGRSIDIEKDDPALVDGVAMRLDEVLAAFPRSDYPDTGLVIEAKSPEPAYEWFMAMQIEDTLARFDREDGSVVVSSMNERILDHMGDHGASGTDVPRMRVFDYITRPTTGDVDRLKEKGIEHLAVNQRLARADLLDYARGQGIGTVSWYWETQPNHARANQNAVERGFDAAITDDGPGLESLNRGR